MKTLRIATRQSPLAMWQAEFVQSKLQALHPDVTVELLPMTTKGDQILNSPLALIGGKGLFVKELEHALLDGRADIAVHSMKDVPPSFPEGLGLGAILKRHSPFDAVLSNQYNTLDELPDGAHVGTASQRRKAQILARFPHLKISTLRGNIQTRIAKLDAGEFDAILLAASGLERMGLESRIKSVLSAGESLPAVGQGALGIEVRKGDAQVAEWLAPLIDTETQINVAAERQFSQRLGGSCSVPLGCFATHSGDQFEIEGLLAQPDGKLILRSQRSGKTQDALEIANALADDLFAQGAQKILDELEHA